MTNTVQGSPRLSVVVATRNEEANLTRCLNSVKSIANEIVVVDEHSTDKTKEIAESFGAKVFLEPHHAIFHVTKQVALDKATGDWILQLDADETVTPELAKEILEVVVNPQPSTYSIPRDKLKLFIRHQKLLESRDGKIGTNNGEIVVYFLPRRNIFLGKPLIHAGVYPDGVIRFFKRGKAKFPQMSVHEQMEVDGKVGWLPGDLLHYDSPTLKRYFSRLNRYTDLKAQELEKEKVSKNIVFFALYTIYKPLITFCSLFIRHLGFLDGFRGFLWSFLSALHFPIAYFKYLTNNSEFK